MYYYCTESQNYTLINYSNKISSGTSPKVGGAGELGGEGIESGSWVDGIVGLEVLGEGNKKEGTEVLQTIMSASCGAGGVALSSVHLPLTPTSLSFGVQT